MPVIDYDREADCVHGADLTDRTAYPVFFILLFAIAVIYLWVLPIGSSLWLDETATFWVVKDGIANVLTRSFDWAGQSPLYYLTAWAAFVLGGPREWVLRLPSLLFALAAAWLLHRLAARLFDRSIAHLAVLVFVCSESVAFAAADARPYALGLCLLIASALALVEWLDTGRKRHAAGYILWSALAIYAHGFFGSTCLALAGYAAWKVWNEARIKLRELIAAWIAIGVLIMPLVLRLRHFYQARALHSFTRNPGFDDLFAGIAPSVLVGSIAIGVILARLIFSKTELGSAAPRRNLALAIAWALTPPLLMFAISWLSPAKVFVSRYYIACVPGLSLVAAWAVRSLLSASGCRIVAITIVTCAIVSFGTFHHGLEDWAGAMRKTRAVANGGNMPVLVASGFVEATDPKALSDPNLQEVLFAPQTIYPPGGTLVRLPYRLDDNSAEYVEHVLAGVKNQARFLLVVRFQGVLFEPWLRGRLAAEGFHAESLGTFDNVGVFLYRRAGK